MTFEMALALFIVVLVIGISFTIFRSTWGPVIHAVYEGIKDLIHMLRTADWEKINREAEERERNKVREPLTWAKVKYHYAMPLLFVGVFPIYYLLIRKANMQIGDNTDIGAIVICAFIIIGLVMLVLYVLGQNEKNIRKKFWLELIVALFLEIGVAFDFHLLMEGYFFESARGPKSLAQSLLFIPFYILYFEKTHRNWKALQDGKSSS